MSESRLLVLGEPTLTFRHDQAVEDPRDGLTLFGPLDAGSPYGIRAGVIGTAHGIGYFRHWVRRIQGRLTDDGSQIARPPFPGFETTFRIPWNADPVIAIEVPESEIHDAVHLDDRHQRVHRTVGVFADRIIEAQKTEEIRPDIWFVVEPDIVYEYCRPQSNVAAAVRIKATNRLKPRSARRLRAAPSLFEDDNAAAIPYQYDVDFHNQLKARLLPSLALTQIVRESTILPVVGIPEEERPKNDNRKFQAAIAWNIGTAAFYKSGGRPWKIDGIRDGVCYIGLVFKRDETQGDPRSACCAAQMFLDSGDGMVFKGAVGPWYSGKPGDFHLSRNAARELIAVALRAFKGKTPGPPAELFIHGQVDFSDEEWRGFRDAIDTSKTNLVGIKIRGDSDLRLFRWGTRPVLRGTAYIRHRTSAYLWSKGFAPRLRTYVGREVPRPLRIDIARGGADMEVVLRDILALTKLNYNTCLLSDGLPVTLRFADAVGEILTAGPNVGDNPLPFKHYI